jgi:hypothetical protein
MGACCLSSWRLSKINSPLKHRELDVDKVREEVQMQALENLRLAKRILTDQLEDPKIDKKIVVEGNVGTNIDVDNS